MKHVLPWLRLQFTPGLGRTALFRLIEHFDSAENILAAADSWPKLYGLRSGLASNIPKPDDPKIQQACETLDKIDGWLCSFWDTDYPAALRNIPDPPALLYGRGCLPAGEALAIVGARYPSVFGRQFTEELAQELAESGLIIISGLARGIDAAAHRGALTAGGQTLAVLGCGIDRVYPQENAKIFEQIIEQGAILSEYPPGTEPLPGHFPGRNRIISGMSRGTLVVEAASNSGSLITAEFALEQGREVMAVPGSIECKTCFGPNHLIKQGAHPVTEASDILELFGLYCPPGGRQETTQKPHIDLPEPAAGILARLDSTPRHSDELGGESGLTPMELSAILLHLELHGYVEKLPGGRYVCRRKALSPYAGTTEIT